MKKKIYSTFFALLMAAGTMAQVSMPNPVMNENMQMASDHAFGMKLPSKADDLAGNELYISYCQDPQPFLRMGVDTYDMASYFDEMLIGKFVGDKVSRIRVYIGNEVKGLTIWLREKLDEEPVFSQEIAQDKLTKAGWIEVELTAEQAYTIKKGGYYVGYTMTEKKVSSSDKTYYPIAVTGTGTLLENTMLFSVDGGENWGDYTAAYISNKYILALGVQTAIISNNHTECDAVVSHFKGESSFIKREAGKTQTKVAFSGYLYNAGQKPINSFDLVVSAPGAETVTSPLQLKGDGLPAGVGVQLTGEITVPTTAENITITAEVANVNGGDFEDGYKGNDKTDLNTIYFYEQSAEKTAFVEMYTTTKCPNCPYGHRVMEALPKNRKKVLVAHHVGYYTDDFTLDDSNKYMNTFGVTGAPNATIDRTYLPEEGSVAFSTGYKNASSGAAVVVGHMDYTDEAYPAFATIEIAQAYNKETRELTVVVTGNKFDAKLFDVAATKPRVNVFLTEDGLVLAQSGGSTKYIHDHVIRAIAGGIWGREVTWNGDAYSVEFKMTVDEAWNEDNVNIVAFLSEENTDSFNYHNVMNAAEVDLNSNGTSIHEQEIANLQVEVVDRAIRVTGDYDDFSIYTMLGVPVQNMNLAKGIYLVKIDSGTKSIVCKVMVNQ